MFRLVITILLFGSIYGQIFDPQTGEEIKPQFDPQTGEEIKPQFDNQTGESIEIKNKSSIRFIKQDLIFRNGGKQIRIKENQKIYVNGQLKIYKGIDYSNKLIRFFNTPNKGEDEKIISFDNIINIRYGKLLTTPAEKGEHFESQGLKIGALFGGGTMFLLGYSLGDGFFIEEMFCTVILVGIGVVSGGFSGALIGYTYGIIGAANTVVHSNFSKLIQIGPEDWEIVAPD